MEKGTMKKQIVKTMAFAFLVILSVSISGTQLVAGQGVQYPPRAYIFIDPASKGAAIGQVFTVDVKINADSFWDIATYAVTVEYNSTIITLLNVTEGGFLKQGGASTFGWNDTSVPGVFQIVDTKLSDPVPSSGVDTLFTLQFNVTCQFSHRPISCNLELNNTDLARAPHPGPPIPPWPPDITAEDIPYDPRPVPPAQPYTHYTVGGTFSVNLGDVNNDGTINLQDLVTFVNAYGSHCANYHYQGEPASPNWNERADLAPSFGQIGLTDLVTFAVYCINP
jgi:hypothetical protein